MSLSFAFFKSLKLSLWFEPLFPLSGKSYCFSPCKAKASLIAQKIQAAEVYSLPKQLTFPSYHHSV